MTRRGWRQWILQGLLLALFTAVIAGPIYTRRLMTPTLDDYDAHVGFTLTMLRRELPPTFVIAHPLLQVLIGGLYWAGRGHIDIYFAEALVLIAAQAATAVLLWAWLGPRLLRQGGWLRLLAALGTTLAAPLMLLAPLDGRFYFGYIGLASYHNPTIHLLRPFALGGFILLLNAFRAARMPVWQVILLASLTLLGALVKPSFAFSFFPVALLAAGWMRLRKLPFDGRALLGGFLVPALLSLLLQAAVTYLLPDADPGGIFLAPFLVERGFSGWLGLKFLLSILFPLSLLPMLFRAGAKGLGDAGGLRLAWFGFLSGAAQLYLLAEGGERLYHGNFRWSAQITLFLLFCAALYALVNHAEKLKSWQKALAWAAFGLHLAAGAVYYVYCWIGPGYA